MVLRDRWVMASEKTVVFVAPFFRPTTLRFVDAVAALEGVRLGVISQDGIEHMPPGLRGRIDGHYRVENALDVGHLVTAVRAMQRHFGHVDRLLGTLEQAQEQLAAVREVCGIEGMRPAVSHRFRDKATMKEVLRAAGLPVARHRRVHSLAQAREFVTEVGFPVVAKPLDGAASVATFRVTDLAELEQAMAALKPSAQHAVQIEEFVRGLERSFETVSVGGEPVWVSYTEYAPQPLHVMENKWIQWTVLLPREETTDDLEAIRAPGLAAIKALGMHTGLTHLEWFRRADGSVAISEVAARPPGAQIMTLNSYAHETDMYRAWARMMVHERWEVGPKKWSVGCAFFRAERPGRVRRVRGLDEAQREVGSLVVEAHLPQEGWMTTTGYEGDGYAIVRAETTEEARRALSVLISRVKIETQ